MTTIAFIGGRPDEVQRTMDAAATTRALVLEPDPETARRLRARHDWTAWAASGRLALLEGPDYHGATAVARAFPDLHTAHVVVNSRCATLNAADVERAREVLSRLAFAAKANDGARRASAGRYLLHTLANAARLARESDVRALAGLGRGRAAVIAGAGPSLDTNAADLLACRDRAIVIACDTAARPLALRGIAPDLIVASDPSQANAGHVTSLPAVQSWLVAEGSVHPTALAAFDRRVFSFRVAEHEPWPWLSDAGCERGVLPTWGSVATTAFSLAVAMECDPITFVGADFCFTDGRPYCRGTAFEAQWSTWMAGGAAPADVWTALLSRWQLISTTDVNGSAVQTAPHLVAFRDWIVEEAARQRRSVVNSTGAGLLTGPSVRQRSLRDVLGAQPPIDRPSFDRLLRSAHRSVASALEPVLRSVDDVLHDPVHHARAAWRHFTAGAVTDPAIDAALRSAEYLAWALGTQSSRAVSGSPTALPTVVPIVAKEEM